MAETKSSIAFNSLFTSGQLTLCRRAGLDPGVAESSVVDFGGEAWCWSCGWRCVGVGGISPEEN